MTASLAEMARDGALGNEGVAMWLGRRHGTEVEITNVVGLRGPGVTKRPDLLMIDAPVMNDVTDLAERVGVRLVAQIHSHGIRYGTWFSRTDHLYGVRAPWFLSLVAPNYAMDPGTPLSACGVYVFETNRGFRRMNADEVDLRIKIVERDVSFHLVGE
jgi:hypothetical protein